MKKIIASVLIVAISGCATGSKDIAAAYTSPITYQAFDCQQIAAETARLQSKVAQLGGRLDQAASNDKALAGVGMLLFWPALFALGGTKQQEAEYATLKGQYEALEQASIEKKCALPSPGSTPVLVPVKAADTAS